jgi:hypothetical protein
MPEICRFFGIVIKMHFNDHAPPHFHARYGRFTASIAISRLALLKGRLPPRVLGFVLEWAALHRDELLEDWEIARRRGDVKPIQPLE